ncbi:WD40 repeat domain-containing serine/threonine protein kinase [Streptomyces sp. NPDC087218]|uniref:WD40 repeat domain-containing serine/threonine protein kinase n=1 Tax=Streptomyces sp. NPDC087218 TaxID=3365769 RepID=UPI0037F1CDA6
MDPLQPGDPRRIGPYRLEGRLGAGGMGQVFLGLTPGGGRKVAVKLIRPDYAKNPRFRERFALEVQAARRVGGFHTAQVIDADPAAEAPWMVTAFISGPSLQDVVLGGDPLDPDAVRELGAGLAEGLGAIHACGLVHRDLKPGNVIMADDGPRIIDFGIAQVGNASALTTTGAPVGTYAFMSPEQVRGEEVGPADDVFSLGCVLAFAASGQGPFDAPNIPAIVRRILDEPPRLDGLPDGFPRELRELITDCLTKDRAQRPELAEILRRTAPSSSSPGTGTRVEAQPPTRTPKPTSTEPGTGPDPAPEPDPGERRRPTRRTLLLGGAAAAVAAVPAVVFWPEGEKENPGGEKEKPGRPRPEGPAPRLLKGKVPVASAVFSPDGRTLVAPSYRPDMEDEPDDEGDSGCIQLWDVATRRLSTLTYGAADFLPCVAVFSPDGKTLAVGSAGSDSVTLWNMATGSVTATLKHKADIGDDVWSWTNSLAYSPDGRTLAVAGSTWNTAGQGQLRLWDLSRSRPVATILEGDHEGSFYTVEFSPDGRSIAAAGESGVRLWDRRRRHVTAARQSTAAASVAFSPDGRTLASCDSAYGKNSGGIWLRDAANGRATTLTDKGVNTVRFSPDGKSLASTGEDGLKVWDVAAGRATELADGTRYWLALSPDGRTLATSEARAPKSKRNSTDVQLWKVP